MENSKVYNLLLMGPLAPPFTGQSVAFTTLVDGLKSKHNVKVLNISNRNSVLNSLILFFQIICNLLSNKYDAVYFTCSRTFLGSVRDVLLLTVSKIRSFRVINHLHGSDFKSFYDNLPRIYKELYFWAYSSIETTIVLVEGMEVELIDFPKMKVEVVSNCYNHQLDLLPEKKDPKLGEIRLLYLSNLMKSKGIIDLLKACEELFFKYPFLKLDIAGSLLADSVSTKDSITKEFVTLMETLDQKYPSRIAYHGTSSGASKSDLLWKSDIFILPTFYKTEALPISILEAMRAGNYIMSTRHRYIPKIVTEKNGCLFGTNSVSEIVEAFEKLFNEKVDVNLNQNYNIVFAMENYNEVKYIKKVSDIVCRTFN